MNVGRSLLALVVAASTLTAAEIHLVAGGAAVKGEIVSVSDKELVYQAGDKKVTRPISEILKIDYRPVAAAPVGQPYSLVELTDGTQVMAETVALKGKTFEVKLLSGPAMKLPVEQVANVLLSAAKEEHRREWKTRVLNTRGREAIVVKKNEAISSIECVLGEGDADGTKLAFAVTIEDKTEQYSRPLSTLHGIIFKNVLDPKAAPAVSKLLDTLGNVVMVTTVAAKDGGLEVTTPAGAKIEFKAAQMARLDYTPGKLDYLSDLVPTIVDKSNVDEDEGKRDQWHVYKDTNAYLKALSVEGTAYSRGLLLKPYAELLYDLRGSYRTFEAVVGLDDAVGGVEDRGKPMPATLVIEADGKELASVTIAAEPGKRSKKLTLNVKDVQKLKVVVKGVEEPDFGGFVALGDAKVRKE